MQRAIRHLNNKFQKSSKSSDSKKSPEIFGDKVSNTALELDQGEYFFDPATGLLIDNSDYNAEPPNTKANYFKSLTQVATLGRDKLSDFGKRMTGKNKPTLDQDDQDFYKNLDMGVEEQIIRDKQIE